MQFDLLRAFPYPVLRPKVDDYIDGDIQATVYFQQSSDNLKITAEVDFALSVPEILALIDENSAEYVVVFSCRDTYFRKAVISTEPRFSEVFESGSLRGEVLIYPYVMASKDIIGFTSKWINEEFGAGPFSFPKGSVLALDEPQSIYIDRDSFKPISSSFILVKNDALPDNEWRVESSSDRVNIAVSPALKERIDHARNNNKKRAILLNSIYFAAVMQCLSLLRQSEDYDSYRWANIFRSRMSDLNIDIKNHEEHWIAQQLMKHPFSVVDSYFFGESQNDQS